MLWCTAKKIEKKKKTELRKQGDVPYGEIANILNSFGCFVHSSLHSLRTLNAKTHSTNEEKKNQIDAYINIVQSMNSK